MQIPESTAICILIIIFKKNLTFMYQTQFIFRNLLYILFCLCIFSYRNSCKKAVKEKQGAGWKMKKQLTGGGFSSILFTNTTTSSMTITVDTNNIPNPFCFLLR